MYLFKNFEYILLYLEAWYYFQKLSVTWMHNGSRDLTIQMTLTFFTLIRKPAKNCNPYISCSNDDQNFGYKDIVFVNCWLTEKKDLIHLDLY